MTDIFPPTRPEHVYAYDSDEVMRGYRDHRPSDPIPLGNHSGAYRWGFMNRRHDITGTEDGLSDLRKQYIEYARSMN